MDVVLLATQFSFIILCFFTFVYSLGSFLELLPALTEVANIVGERACPIVVEGGIRPRRPIRLK